MMGDKIQFLTRHSDALIVIHKEDGLWNEL